MTKIRAVIGLAASALVASVIGAQAAITYATAVDWTNNGTVTDAARTHKSNALGSPDQVGLLPVKWLSLGIGGSAIFGFGGKVLGAGTIFEVTYNCVLGAGGACTYAETADIYGVSADDYTLGGSVDPSGYVPDLADRIASVPNASAQSGFAFTVGKTYDYLLVRDTSSRGGGRDGFDIDAIGATVVPLPAAGFLLLGALGGLGFVSRRRKAA